MERTSLSSKRMAMPRCVARKTIWVPSVMRGLDQFVVLVDADRNDAAGHDVGEVLERRLLDCALLRGEEDELAFFFKIANGQNGAHIFARLQVEQALHGFALARRAHVGNLVDLEPVDAAGVGKAEQEGVGGIDDQLRDEILLARLHAHASRAAAPLLAIDADGRALQVALVAHRDGDLLVGDQVFELQLGDLIDDLRAARVAVLVANLFEFLDDDRAQLRSLARMDSYSAIFSRICGELVEDFIDGELGQAIELQLEDGVHLAQREALFLMRQPLAVEVDDDLFALAPGIEIFAGLDARP